MKNINSIIIEGKVTKKTNDIIIIDCNEMKIPILYHHKNLNINDNIRAVGKVGNYNGNLVIDSEYIEISLTN